MVPAQDTWFVHRSDCPALTFGKLEFSLNEHGVAPTSLPQPNVGLFPIRAGGPSRLLRLRQIKLPRGHANRSRSELTAVSFLLLLLSPPRPIRTLHCFGPGLPVLDNAFTNWPLHIATPPTVDFSRGVASSTVCTTIGSMDISRSFVGI